MSCQGVTKKNTPCKKAARPGGQFCHLHSNQAPRQRATPIVARPRSRPRSSFQRQPARAPDQKQQLPTLNSPVPPQVNKAFRTFIRSDTFQRDYRAFVQGDEGAMDDAIAEANATPSADPAVVKAFENAVNARRQVKVLPCDTPEGSTRADGQPCVSERLQDLLFQADITALDAPRELRDKCLGRWVNLSSDRKSKVALGVESLFVKNQGYRVISLNLALPGSKTPSWWCFDAKDLFRHVQTDLKSKSDRAWVTDADHADAMKIVSQYPKLLPVPRGHSRGRQTQRYFTAAHLDRIWRHAQAVDTIKSLIEDGLTVEDCDSCQAGILEEERLALASVGNSLLPTGDVPLETNLGWLQTQVFRANQWRKAQPIIGRKGALASLFHWAPRALTAALMGARITRMLSCAVVTMVTAVRLGAMSGMWSAAGAGAASFLLGPYFATVIPVMAIVGILVMAAKLVDKYTTWSDTLERVPVVGWFFRLGKSLSLTPLYNLLVSSTQVRNLWLAVSSFSSIRQVQEIVNKVVTQPFASALTSVQSLSVFSLCASVASSVMSLGCILLRGAGHVADWLLSFLFPTMETSLVRQLVSSISSAAGSVCDFLARAVSFVAGVAHLVTQAIHISADLVNTMYVLFSSANTPLIAEFASLGCFREAGFVIWDRITIDNLPQIGAPDAGLVIVDNSAAQARRPSSLRWTQVPAEPNLSRQIALRSSSYSSPAVAPPQTWRSLSPAALALVPVTPGPMVPVMPVTPGTSSLLDQTSAQYGQLITAETARAFAGLGVDVDSAVAQSTDVVSLIQQDVPFRTLPVSVSRLAVAHTEAQAAATDVRAKVQQLQIALTGSSFQSITAQRAALVRATELLERTGDELDSAVTDVFNTGQMPEVVEASDQVVRSLDRVAETARLAADGAARAVTTDTSQPDAIVVSDSAADQPIRELLMHPEVDTVVQDGAVLFADDDVVTLTAARDDLATAQELMDTALWKADQMSGAQTRPADPAKFIEETHSATLVLQYALDSVERHLQSFQDVQGLEALTNAGAAARTLAETETAQWMALRAVVTRLRASGDPGADQLADEYERIQGTMTTATVYLKMAVARADKLTESVRAAAAEALIMADAEADAGSSFAASALADQVAQVAGSATDSQIARTLQDSAAFAEAANTTAVGSGELKTVARAMSKALVTVPETRALKTAVSSARKLVEKVAGVHRATGVPVVNLVTDLSALRGAAREFLKQSQQLKVTLAAAPARPLQAFSQYAEQNRAAADLARAQRRLRETARNTSMLVVREARTADASDGSAAPVMLQANRTISTMLGKGDAILKRLASKVPAVNKAVQSASAATSAIRSPSAGTAFGTGSKELQLWRDPAVTREAFSVLSVLRNQPGFVIRIPATKAQELRLDATTVLATAEQILESQGVIQSLLTQRADLDADDPLMRLATRTWSNEQASMLDTVQAVRDPVELVKSARGKSFARAALQGALQAEASRARIRNHRSRLWAAEQLMSTALVTTADQVTVDFVMVVRERSKEARLSLWSLERQIANMAVLTDEVAKSITVPAAVISGAQPEELRLARLGQRVRDAVLADLSDSSASRALVVPRKAIKKMQLSRRAQTQLRDIEAKMLDVWTTVQASLSSSSRSQTVVQSMLTGAGALFARLGDVVAARNKTVAVMQASERNAAAHEIFVEAVSIAGDAQAVAMDADSMILLSRSVAGGALTPPMVSYANIIKKEAQKVMDLFRFPLTSFVFNNFGPVSTNANALVDPSTPQIASHGVLGFAATKVIQTIQEVVTAQTESPAPEEPVTFKHKLARFFSKFLEPDSEYLHSSHSTLA